MNAWTEGYVSDIPYALGFYRETVPAHIAFAAVCVGKHPGLALNPKRILELGFGMGLGFVINAAANPHIQFEGIDFNPLHVAHARGLVDEAELANVSLREASFQDLAREAHEGQHDLDIIVLHGILTWVSKEAHEAIVEIARKRLKPGGLLYVSYNCMPGWAPVLPMQRLMRENAKRMSGTSDQQTGAGLDLVKALMTDGALYFKGNTTIEKRVEKLLTMDRNYLAHEYLNANWHIFHFADVAEMFAKAKLGFLASATLAENMDDLAAPEDMRKRIGSEGDPIFKETLRDIASNKQFRRDLFARGVANLTPAESNALLSSFCFALTATREKITFKFQGPLGEVTGNTEIYSNVADLLTEKIANFDEVARLPVFANNRSIALQTLALLVHSGQVLPVLSSGSFDSAPAQRLNQALVEKMLQGRVYNFLAVPIAGAGVQTSQGELLMLSGVYADGHCNVDKLAEYLVKTMQHLGLSWMKEGGAVHDLEERQAFARSEATAFFANKLPLLRRLGVL